MLPRLLAREDAEVSEMVAHALRARTASTCSSATRRDASVEGEKRLVGEQRGPARCASSSTSCCARSGAWRNTTGYGLEELGIPVTRARTVETNEYLQTIYPNIYACGDVAGPYQFTHTAAHQAWYAAVNALFGALRRRSGPTTR